ncbi:Domain of uncharacterised function DUF1828 [uncultured Ruminococcus sp.]|uniref:DUF1828 domain-containing protein n=1 Tax=Hydrogeniiclostridium mannosilyticum TaxID=2764322 RepID=A0A328UI46_9FIRM|nr:DUF1828 domain-containing protein [Hydrogeniiclostridium mannosilyticum]RAQ28341.1 hypothetical protein DPQ25_10105 [Hydrogeniiclostridium mannosilyticum]SCH74897.1 Domain of uncharacterised function DUF1828 [uncultured Ruminococcus sp.]DAV06382.1 MAG TPA: protein of unknown function DUF1828 [Caudoviricetes sp.]
MTIIDKLHEQFGQQIALEEVSPDVMRVYAPFFHEDGDMLSMYLEIQKNGEILIRDFGNTLMRVSYTFDIESSNKKNILSNIVKSNHGILDDGELMLPTNLSQLPQAIFQFSQLVAKVSNVDILRRETVKSLFFDYLNEYLTTNLSAYNIIRDAKPSNDKSLIVDYEISGSKPLFLFGVNETSKAAKVVISCLTFQKQKIPFRSLVIHEDFGSLTSFYRNQITNAVDKQFTSLEDFKTEGLDYIQRELAS